MDVVFHCSGCRRTFPSESQGAIPVCPACGGMLETASGLGQVEQSRTGSGSVRAPKIGPYAVQRTLGHGAFGVVYLAAVPGDPRSVAVKLLLATDPEAMERFRREATVLRRLDHPGLIRVLDFGQKGRHYYYAMEYCPGETLQELLARGPLPVERTLQLVIELARTVVYIHAQGILHRDLKPANVLIDKYF